jgi:hypothetical protein
MIVHERTLLGAAAEGGEAEAGAEALKISSMLTPLLTLALSGCATARWVEFGWSDNPKNGVHFFHYDAASLERSRDVVSGSQMITYDASDGVTLSKFDVDCRTRRIQFRGTSVEHAGRVLSRSRTGPSGWSEIASGTIASSLAELVCTDTPTSQP